MSLTTWREGLAQTMRENDDESALISVAPHESVLDVEFDPGYGLSCGPEFLAWTSGYVYFPVVYDGAEWVGSAPRNPVPDGQSHVGSQ